MPYPCINQHPNIGCLEIQGASLDHRPQRIGPLRTAELLIKGSGPFCINPVTTGTDTGPQNRCHCFRPGMPTGFHELKRFEGYTRSLPPGMYQPETTVFSIV
jgi:hypothetical protein